jgi:large subunit ribosomal protein L25
MEKLVVKAVRRDVIGKQVKSLRREGKLPAVLYGHHINPVPILLDFRDASRALTGLAPSTLITVDVEGDTHQALVREKQRNKITGALIHVDFLAVSMLEKLRSEVNIELIGISPAVKDLDGILVSNVNQLEVECLPQDLPEKIVVDISSLDQIGDAIYLRDLVLSDKIKIMDDMDTVVVSVTAQEAEEVEVEVEEVAEVEPEVVEHGKIEEEEL